VRFSVFTVSLPEYTPEQAVACLATWGFDGIEWRVTDQPDAPAGTAPGFWFANRCTVPLITFPSAASALRALAAGAGLAVPNVGTYVSGDDLRSVEHAMRGASALGAPSLRVTMPNYDGTQPYVEVRDRARRQFADVAALAREHGVRALVELHMGTIVPSASAAVAFLDGLDPQAVGVIHDAGNMVFEGHEHYRMGLELLGPLLAHVHLKNAQWTAVRARRDGSTDWRPSFAPLRTGAVDVRALFTALRTVGYDGWVSFEDFSTEAPVDERTPDNLTYAREVLDRVDAARA
jgi:sugar phosphate isomerase/epimerase